MFSVKGPLFSAFSISELIEAKREISWRVNVLVAREICATLSFCPKHWLLCHLGLYKFDFEFESESLRSSSSELGSLPQGPSLPSRRSARAFCSAHAARLHSRSLMR